MEFERFYERFCLGCKPHQALPPPRRRGYARTRVLHILGTAVLWLVLGYGRTGTQVPLIVLVVGAGFYYKKNSSSRSSFLLCFILHAEGQHTPRDAYNKTLTP